MPMKTNANNERLKRKYVEYIHHAKGYSDATIDGVLKSIRRYEDYTCGKDFKQFNRKMAMGFGDALKSLTTARDGQPIGMGTVYSTINQVKAFFVWLAAQPGYRSRISYADIEYLNITEKDKRRAKAPRLVRTPTIDQIRAVVTGMKIENEIDRRDQALIAFTLLTIARDGAICSAKIGHVKLEESLFFQDGRDMDTKFSKTIFTTFFPVGDPFLQIVKDWIGFLLKEKLWGLDDPLFPANKVVALPGKGFQCIGLDRKPWTTASAMRGIFKQRFVAMGLPYYHPHSFRRTVTRLGEKICLTPESFKAWSQNMGHENVGTTFNSYGDIPQYRQAELIMRMHQSVAGI